MARVIGNVSYDEEYIENSRGIKLFTCKWVPVNQEPKALIFICHAYAMECSITMSSTAVRLVHAGFGVYGMDYEGHGKSEGLPAFILNFDDLVTDCFHHFRSICEEEENIGKKRYMLGEAMGGTVAIFLERKEPRYWDGAIFVAPMCRIADNIKPPEMLICCLEKLCNLIPTWKTLIAHDIIDVAFKEPHIRTQIRENQYCYKDRPRLKTGFELLRVCEEIEQHLQEVSMPFLVLHGEDDKVTDANISKELYRKASSEDKTLKLYPGMWHGLLYGEPPQNIEIVFGDIFRWLEERNLVGNRSAVVDEKKDRNCGEPESSKTKQEATKLEEQKDRNHNLECPKQRQESMR